LLAELIRVDHSILCEGDDALGDGFVSDIGLVLIEDGLYWRVCPSESNTRHSPVASSRLMSKHPASHHSSNERAASKRVNVGQRLCHAVMSSSRVGCNISIKRIASLAPCKPSRHGEPLGRPPAQFRGLAYAREIPGWR
jgi:hypothetical protein